MNEPVGGEPRVDMDFLSEILLPVGKRFTREQADAIMAPLEPGVIIAGAGSGKTTAMAARVVWLVGNGYLRPEEVLGLTFTNKAAGGLADKIVGALSAANLDRPDSDEGRPTVMTYDAFAARIVADHGSRAGIDLPSVVSGVQRFQLAATVVSSATGPFQEADEFSVGTLIGRLLKLDESMTSHLISAHDLVEESAAIQAELASAPLTRRKTVGSEVVAASRKTRERLDLLSLVGEYQALKRRLGVAEFFDQMRVACDIATRFPSVGAKLRDQYRVVLLDEYQDTSTAQVRLLRALFSGSAGDGMGHAVTAVGDPFQALYEWRGAAASNIIEFAGEFPRADGTAARRYVFTTNQRSDRRIIDVGNRMTAPLRADKRLVTLTEGLETRMRPGEDRVDGWVYAADFVTWQEEVSWIAERIIDDHRSGRVDAWKQIAVLSRGNARLGTIFHELTSREVPCEIVGVGGLLSVPEVAQVVATLRLLDDVTANPQVVELLSGPRWRIGPDDLAALGERAARLGKREREDDDDDPDRFDRLFARDDSAVSLLEAIDDLAGSRVSREAQRRMRRFAAELAQLRRHIDEPMVDLVRRVVTVIGLDAELASGPDGADPATRAQLDAFIAVVSEHVDVESDQSLVGLLAYLDAEQETGNGIEQATPSQADSVKLMTVHRAKGLEWPVVYVPALVDTVFPSTRITDNPVRAADQIPASLRGDRKAFPQVNEYSQAGLKAYAEEFKGHHLLGEDRVAYVAVTRAQHRLIGTAHVWEAGTAKPKKRSSYYETIYAAAQSCGTVLAHVDDAPSENPSADVDTEAPWPMPIDADDLEARRQAAALVADAAAGPRTPIDVPLAVEDQELADEWSREVDRVIARASSGTQTVGLPASLSVSNLMRAHANPGALAADLLRPMPRKPSEGNRVGTRFHEWVERYYGLAPTLDALEEELPAAFRGDDEAVAELIARFQEGCYAGLVPVGVEVAFMLVLDGQLVRGRIDAVFRSADPRFDYQVVDWKTYDRPGDGLQLALYRLAWAQATGVDPARVDAVFYHVRSGQVERPARVASEEELAAMVGGMTADTLQP